MAIDPRHCHHEKRKKQYPGAVEQPEPNNVPPSHAGRCTKQKAEGRRGARCGRQTMRQRCALHPLHHCCETTAIIPRQHQRRNGYLGWSLSWPTHNVRARTRSSEVRTPQHTGITTPPLMNNRVQKTTGGICFPLEVLLKLLFKR